MPSGSPHRGPARGLPPCALPLPNPVLAPQASAGISTAWKGMTLRRLVGWWRPRGPASPTPGRPSRAAMTSWTGWMTPAPSTSRAVRLSLVGRVGLPGGRGTWVGAGGGPVASPFTCCFLPHGWFMVAHGGCPPRATAKEPACSLITGWWLPSWGWSGAMTACLPTHHAAHHVRGGRGRGGGGCPSLQGAWSCTELEGPGWAGSWAQETCWRALPPLRL